MVQRALGDFDTAFGDPLFDRVVVEHLGHEIGGLKILLRMGMPKIMTAGADV